MNTHSHQPAEPASSSTGLLASSSVAQGTVLTCIHGQQRSSLSIFSSILFECHLLAISQMERLRSDSPCVIAAKWCWHPAPMHAKGGGRAQKRMATCRHVAPILTEQGFFFFLVMWESHCRIPTVLVTLALTRPIQMQHFFVNKEKSFVLLKEQRRNTGLSLRRHMVQVHPVTDKNTETQVR